MSVQDHTSPPVAEDTPAPFGTAALFLCAIALGAMIGLVLPDAQATLSRGIDTTLLVMIFLLFFELRLGSLVKAFGNVRFLGLAWAANFVVIPVVGFGIASLAFPDQPLLFAGLMIYFLAPCTDWFLGFTRMARGDTELGAALIPINMVTQLLLFPLWLWLFANATGAVEFAAMPGMLMQWFVLPLLAAQLMRFALTRTLSESSAELISSWASRFVPVVLAALIFQIFASHVGAIGAHLGVVVWVAVAVSVFFAATSVTSAILSRIGRFAHPQRVLLSMTMAARNAPLMLALTAAILPGRPLVLIVIVAAMLVEIPLLTALKQVLLKQSREG